MAWLNLNLLVDLRAQLGVSRRCDALSLPSQVITGKCWFQGEDCDLLRRHDEKIAPSVSNRRHVSAVLFIAVTAVKRVIFLDRETQLCVCAVAQMEQFTLVKAVKRKENTRDRPKTDMVVTPCSP